MHDTTHSEIKLFRGYHKGSLDIEESSFVDFLNEINTYSNPRELKLVEVVQIQHSLEEKTHKTITQDGVTRVIEIETRTSYFEEKTRDITSEVLEEICND